MTASEARDPRPWLIWDGSCGFCCWCILWARRRGADLRFRITAYQDAPPPEMDEALRRECARAVQLLRPGGERLSAGRAVMAVLRELGWGWFARALSAPPLVWPVELGYRIVAGNRPFFSRIASADPAECRGSEGTEGASCAPGRRG